MRKLITVLLGLFASSATAGSSNVTPVQTEHFAVQLPGNWVELKSEDAGLWLYANRSQNEQLSVSVLKLARQESQKDLPVRLNEYLSARLKAEHQFAQASKLGVTVPSIESQNNRLVASYTGYQADTDRRFLAFAIINSKRIVCFYLEVLGMPEAEFKVHQAEVISTVKVAD